VRLYSSRPLDRRGFDLAGVEDSFNRFAARLEGIPIADVSLGLSFWSYALFTACMAVVVLYPDKRRMWQRVWALEDD